MDAQNLSKRLAAVAAQVPKGSRLADIGSDHAYLPAHLLMAQQIDFAVAGEVVEGPFENMLKEVEHRGLADHLLPRLANGLDAIRKEDRIDTITIAGMGDFDHQDLGRRPGEVGRGQALDPPAKRWRRGVAPLVG